MRKLKFLFRTLLKMDFKNFFRIAKKVSKKAKKPTKITPNKKKKHFFLGSNLFFFNFAPKE